VRCRMLGLLGEVAPRRNTPISIRVAIGRSSAFSSTRLGFTGVCANSTEGEIDQQKTNRPSIRQRTDCLQAEIQHGFPEGIRQYAKMRRPSLVRIR
jgi:hypothetical protein